MRNSFLLITGLFSLIAVACLAAQQLIQPATEPVGQPEAASSTIEYPTVAEALTALKAREDVLVEVKDGWTIVTEDHDNEIITWSFTPSTHPAPPAVAKRVLYQDQGGWFLDMSIKCEADKAACDQFVQDFEELNEQMRQYIEQDQLTKQAP